MVNQHQTGVSTYGVRQLSCRYSDFRTVGATARPVRKVECQPGDLEAMGYS
jgi:hypothetical protein